MRVRIVGGPTSSSIRILNAETGEDITRGVQKIVFTAEGGKLAKAELTLLAGVDVEAETESEPQPAIVPDPVQPAAPAEAPTASR